MIAVLLLLFVYLCCLATIHDWRLGLLGCVLVAVLQDPIRKVTAGTPPILTLSFLPIYFCMLIRLAMQTNILGISRHYTSLRIPAVLFGVSLLLSTLQTLSYGAGATTLAALGLFSYLGGLPALVLGFEYPRRRLAEIDRPAMVLAGLTAIMLIGVPLEYFGVQFDRPWLKTVGGETLHRWYSDTEWVDMISGFYRSPEVMGWHAAVLVVICLFLMTRRPAWLPLWLILGSWGFGCMLMSGRRKMFLLILTFLAVFALLAARQDRRRLLVFFALAVGVLFVLLPWMVNERYIATAQTTLPGAGERVSHHGWQGPIWLFQEVGLFGFGVGTKTQGTQHLMLDVKTPLTEGGLEKIMVEVGIVGTLTFLVFLVALGRAVWTCFHRVCEEGADQTAAAALIAFVAANGAAFVVAFQIYGDPFVVFLVGFILGLLLGAGARSETLQLRTRENAETSTLTVTP